MAGGPTPYEAEQRKVAELSGALLAIYEAAVTPNSSVYIAVRKTMEDSRFGKELLVTYYERILREWPCANCGEPWNQHYASPGLGYAPGQTSSALVCPTTLVRRRFVAPEKATYIRREQDDG